MRAHKNFLKKRVAAALTAATVLFGTVPAVAQPVDTTADPTWMVTVESGATSEAAPAVPAAEIPDFPEDPSDDEAADANGELPAVPTLTQEKKTVTEPELAEEPTFKHVRTLPDGTEEYKLEAKLNLPAFEGSDQALPLEEISLMSTEASLNIESVEDAEVDGAQLDEDSVDVFNYPENPTEEEEELIPDEVTGDVITLDTAAKVLDAETDLTATIYTTQIAPRSTQWGLYRGARLQHANYGSNRGPVRAGYSRLVVQVGGDQVLPSAGKYPPNSTRVSGRLNSVDRFTAGEGAKLQLYYPLSGSTFGNAEAHHHMTANARPVKVNEPWATCTSDANGECVFDIPLSRGSSYYWVGMAEASPGFKNQPFIRIGGSGNWYTDPGTKKRYAYATPYLESGRTYFSGVNYTRNGSAWQVDNKYGSDWQGTGKSASFMYEARGGRANARSSLGVFQQVRDNPAMPSRCGMNVAMIVDVSGSMGDNGIRTIKGVIRSVADGLQNTSTHLGLFTFASNSPAAGNPRNFSAPADLSSPQGRAAIDNWVRILSRAPHDYDATNWQEALYEVAKYNAANPHNKYDAVYMVTDGNPTYRMPTPGNPRFDEWMSDGAWTEFRDVEGAMGAANLVKSQGSRIIAVGIPSHWSGVRTSRDRELEVSEENLRAISGGRGHDGDVTSLRAADFAHFENSEVLKQAIINSLNTCAVSVERRFYEGEDPNFIPSPENTRPTIEESKNWAFDFTAVPEGRPVVDNKTILPKEKAGHDNLVAEYRLNGTSGYREISIAGARRDKVPDGWVPIKVASGKNAEGRCGTETDLRSQDHNIEDIPVPPGEDDRRNAFRAKNIPLEGGCHYIVYYMKKPTTFKFKLNKVDAQDNNMGLDGAEFKLEGLDAGNKGEQKLADVQSAAKGEFNWDKLKHGRYKLTETKAADGGYLLVKPIYFRVVKDGDQTRLYILSGPQDKTGTEVTADNAGDIYGFPVVGFSQESKDGSVQVTMKLANTKTGEMPKTGGHGVFIQILLGVLLLLAGAFTARRRMVA